MTYRMSCEQLHGLSIKELSALFKLAREAVCTTRPCTAEHAEAVAAMRRIAQVIANKDAQMRAFIPAPRRIKTPKPGSKPRPSGAIRTAPFGRLSGL